MKYHVTIISRIIESDSPEAAAADFLAGNGKVSLLVEPIHPETGQILTTKGQIVTLPAEPPAPAPAA